MLCFWCFFTRNSLDHHGASGGARTSTPHLMIPWNSLRWCIGSVLLGVAKALPPAHTPHTKKRSHVHRKFHLPNGIVYSMIHQSCWWIVTPKKKKTPRSLMSFSGSTPHITTTSSASAYPPRSPGRPSPGHLRIDNFCHFVFENLRNIWSCQNTTSCCGTGFFNGIPMNLHCQEFKHPNAAMA